ncbi:hypothetical protein [Lactococcus garvieae]
MIKIEITKNKNQDGELKCKGGEIVDYLSILAEAIAYLCKEKGLPVDIAVKGLFYELDTEELDGNISTFKGLG